MEQIMARKKGQTYTADQKTKVVLELLKEERTAAQIASEYGVTAKTIQNWKQQFLDNASLAFDVGGATKAYKEEIEELQEENDALAKKLGKTTIERDWLEKKLKSSVSSKERKTLVESGLELSKTRQCELLNISRSSHYYQAVPLSAAAIYLINCIDEISTKNSEYGYRFIHQQLLEDGHSIGKDRVLRYMQIMGLQAIYPHKKKLTSIKDQQHQTYPYLLGRYYNENRQVTVDQPNEVWSGDITYIRMNGGFMYLAAIIDWHSKAILAYRISNSMDATLVTDVLKEVLAKYPRPKIFNSDQGSQYTSHEHTQILKDHGIEISMNGKGRSIDNIAIERFFRTLKHGNIYISDYQTIKELKEGIAAYIHKYNFRRFHSAIDYQKPMNVYLKSITKLAS